MKRLTPVNVSVSFYTSHTARAREWHDIRLALRVGLSVGLKILIVDAEPVVRATIATILKKDGYEVSDTECPWAALEIIKTSCPALIITNVSLRGMSGHDALRLFKENAPKLPVLMVPGLPDEDIIREWKDEEGFDIFPKPFAARDLSEKVRKMLAPRIAIG